MFVLLVRAYGGQRTHPKNSHYCAKNISLLEVQIDQASGLTFDVLDGLSNVQRC